MADEDRAAQRERDANARAIVREADKAGEEPPTFPVDRLQDNAHAYFGVPSSTFAGALAFGKVTKKNLTIDEAREALDGYLAHPVE